MPLANYIVAEPWKVWTYATTGTATTDLIWPGWAQTTATATNIYSTWVDAEYTQRTFAQLARGVTNQRDPVAHLRNERGLLPGDIDIQAERERAARGMAEYQAKLKAAEDRARVLLEANLVLEERLRLAEHGHIFVRGNSGCRYRIRKGRTANIDVVNPEGRVTHRLCAHPQLFVPDFDTMLAQKLALETDDVAFARIANRHERNTLEQVMPVL